MKKYLVVAIVVVLIYAYLHSTTEVEAEGRKWNMTSYYSNRRDAAALLARTNRRILTFLRFLRDKYHIGETDDVIQAEGALHDNIVNLPGDVHNVVRAIVTGYNPEAFYENDPRTGNGTAYTLGKGRHMRICLRNKRSPSQLVDEDTLLFVMLHEASHIGNYNGWDHPPRFWEIFKFVLHEARLAGIYKPVNYAEHPVDYCGLHINYNPLLDGALRNIWE